MQTRLWVIMMFQYRSIDCKKCTTLMQDVDGEAYACVGIGWLETSLYSAKFFCEPALKSSLLKYTLYMKFKFTIHK